MNVVPLETITLARFSGLVNTPFRAFPSPTAELALELAQVVRRPVTGQGDRQYESFSLVFHGPDKTPLSQGLLRLEHAKIGQFDLFIVPIAKGAGIVKYEAVFNRLIEPA